MTSWFTDGHSSTESHRPIPLSILNWVLDLFIVRVLEFFMYVGYSLLLDI